MKKQNAVVLALVVLAVSLIAGSMAWASAHTTDSPLITLPDPEESTTVSQRVTQRKNAVSLKLTNLQIQNITNKCAAAQTRLKNVQAKDRTVAANRQQIYTDLATELDTVIGRLQNQGVDTAQVQAAQTKFDNAIDQYLADALSYKTAMDDAVLVDCDADPSGFDATLQSARQLRAKLVKDSAQIKAQMPQLATVLSSVKDTLINGGKEENR